VTPDEVDLQITKHVSTVLVHSCLVADHDVELANDMRRVAFGTLACSMDAVDEERKADRLVMLLDLLADFGAMLLRNADCGEIPPLRWSWLNIERTRPDYGMLPLGHSLADPVATREPVSS
jgi:hypothetical protein